MSAFEIFDQVIEELEGYDLQSVADEAEVSVPTLRNWLAGKVIAPQLRTFIPVALALGYKVELRKVNHLRLVA